MFFAISRLMQVFRFLHTGLAFILILVGLKMIAADYYHVPTVLTLSVIALVLLVSIAASLAFRTKSA
jgi:tellurite resistance protein TerC